VANEHVQSGNKGWRPSAKQIVIGVIALAVLLAVLQNTRKSNFSFLFFDFEAPVWIWFVATFGAGFAIGMLVARRRAERSSS
jgi:uncharacterized integral membrane protein